MRGAKSLSVFTVLFGLVTIKAGGSVLFVDSARQAAGDPEFYDLLDGYDEGYPGGEEGYIYYQLTQLFPPPQLLELDTTREERKFFYDELGRLVKQVQSSPARYGRARFGKSRYGKGERITHYLYDELDRLVQKTFDDGKTILWEYDPESNVTKMTGPDGKVTRYEYYRDNLLYRVIIERPSEADRVFTYHYDAAGRLEEIEYPEDTEIKAIFRDSSDTPGSGFDANGNLRFLRYEKDGVLIRSFEWTYDNSNNRQSMLDVTPTKAVKWEYGFDWLDRLVSVKRAEAANVGSLPTSPLGSTYLQREYVFDESDNRTFFDDHVEGMTYHYTYDAADQVEEILIYPTAAGHRTIEDFSSFEAFDHDADGNMTKRTIADTSEEISYEWTDQDRLKSVKSDQNGRMQDAGYDIDGLRHRKTDKDGQSSEEYGVGITTAASAPGTSSSNAPSISYIMGHMIMGCEIDGEFRYHLTDALSSVRDVVDDSGAVIKSLEFDEYGNLLSSSGSGTVSPKTWIGGLSVNDDRIDSGLWNMGHRNYMPGVLGRFISRDPIGFAGGLNLYSYPTNPVNYVDPSGLESIASGALPPGWTMTTQPDGVNAYSNQELNLVANIQYPPKPPKPMTTPPPSSTPVPPPILTGNVTSGTASIRPCWDLDNLHPLDYPPSGVDIDTNMRRAQTVGKNMPDSSKFKWFKRMVQNGGPWDFKQQSGRFEPYGNYHYGAVGTAFGLNEEYLARMAGWAQHRAGTSKPEWGVPWGDAPYGDDPRDQRRIRQGCAYARSKGY